MSKNKNYHNYQNYSTNNPAVEKTDEETKLQGSRTAVNPVDEASALSESDKEIITEPKVEEPVAVPTPETETEQESEQEAVKPIIGVVTDCLKLRVRKQPNASAEVLCEIDALSEVQIEEKESTEEFYKVCTEAGVEGFCMKKFIAVKQ